VSSGRDWPTTRAVDGPALAAAVGAEYVGRLPGGNAGAVLARRGGGEVVLTRWDGGRPPPEVDRLRAAGYPVPRMEVVPLPGGGAVAVQERVRGVPRARPGPAVVAELLRLTDRQRGLAAAPVTTPLHLDADGPGFCLHEPPRRWSDRTRELLGWVEGFGPAGLTGRDLVHFDLHLENVLVDDGRVAGVVDWAGARIGDVRFDLVTLGFDLTYRGLDVRPVLERLGPPPAPYVAHLALRYVDWTIRHRPGAVDGWLAVADRWRGLAG
jgi:hypothetical protein